MRGSPLLRTLVVLAALAVTGLALARLTGGGPAPAKASSPPQAASPGPVASVVRVPFELVLSAQAKEVLLEGGGTAIKGGGTAGPMNGIIELSAEDPVLSLRVTWADASPGFRFAKLRLEVPGKETLEHIFSAPGDIDDIWEVP